jgi:hypothetical protein
LIVTNREVCRELLIRISNLDELARPDFLLRGITALGVTPDDDEFVSALLPRVPARQGIETGVYELITTFHAHPKVKAFTLEKLRSREAPIAAAASTYENDPQVRPIILTLAARLPRFLRHLLARRAEERPENPLFKSLLVKCDYEADSSSRLLLSLALAYSVKATDGDQAGLASEFSRRLLVLGPDYSERRFAAFVGLTALDRFDLIASAIAANKDLLGYKPFGSHEMSTEALGIIAEKWDALEKALHTSADPGASFRTDPSIFWDKLASHVWHSEHLLSKFMEYCDNPAELMSASILSALSRVRPRSRLLLDACKRALLGFEVLHRQSPLDRAAARLRASLLFAEQFANESEAQDLLVEASERSEDGAPLVGLALRWPESGVLKRNWDDLRGNRRSPFLWPGILAAAGSDDDAAFLHTTTAYLDREISSPWDFPYVCIRLLSQRMGDRPDLGPQLLERIIASGRGDVKLGFAELYQGLFGKTSHFRDAVATVITQEKDNRDVPRFAMGLAGSRRRPLAVGLQLLL